MGILFTYLRLELRHRMRPAIFIAAGLAVGVGLVITVSAAATGVRNAQAGALAGIGVGFAGAALVTALGPTLTVTVIGSPGAGGWQGGSTPVPVHFSAPVSPGIVAPAVVLGIAGGLLAGALGRWRAARLRPAAALAQVG